MAVFVTFWDVIYSTHVEVSFLDGYTFNATLVFTDLNNAGSKLEFKIGMTLRVKLDEFVIVIWKSTYFSVVYWSEVTSNVATEPGSVFGVSLIEASFIYVTGFLDFFDGMFAILGRHVARACKFFFNEL